jgi:hypothetical protein
MPLSNAEKQRRWRDRNQIVLTDSAADIAEKLIEMDDQAKLKKITRFINDHLKHPDRNPHQRAVALGRTVMSDSSGRRLGKRAALALMGRSWRVEFVTADGKRWANSVRLATKDEAELYRRWYARASLEGYITADVVTAEVLHADDGPANYWITGSVSGDDVDMHFNEGQCVLQYWTEVT